MLRALLRSEKITSQTKLLPVRNSLVYHCADDNDEVDYDNRPEYTRPLVFDLVYTCSCFGWAGREEVDGNEETVQAVVDVFEYLLFGFTAPEGESVDEGESNLLFG